MEIHGTEQPSTALVSRGRKPKLMVQDRRRVRGGAPMWEASLESHLELHERKRTLHLR